jgi:hypothetical protein
MRTQRDLSLVCNDMPATGITRERESAGALARTGILARRTLGLLVLPLLGSACAGPGQGLGIAQCGADRGTVAAPEVRAADVWTYRQIDAYTGIDRGVFRLEVEGVSADAIEARLTGAENQPASESYTRQWGWRQVSNRGWDWLTRLAYASPTVVFSPPFDSTPFPLRAGQSWSDSGFAIDPQTGARIAIESTSKAACWEQVSVPAGSFVALRIERTAYLQDVAWDKSQTTLRQVDWYAPEANRAVMTWHDSYYYDYRQDPRNSFIRGDRLRWDLMEYKAAR